MLFSLIIHKSIAQLGPLLVCPATNISPSTISVGASGGPSYITVTTQNNCTTYLVSESLDWVSCTKSGLTVTVSLSANSGPARDGEVSIGAITLYVHQACGNYPVTPGSISVDRNNFCSNAGGNITLTVVGGSGTYTRWFSGSCGGTQVAYTNGSSISIPAPTSTTTYYGRWENSCSNSTCKYITVNVNQAPELSISGTNPVCPGSTYRYTASSSGLTTYNWSLPSGASEVVVQLIILTSHLVQLLGMFRYQPLMLMAVQVILLPME